MSDSSKDPIQNSDTELLTVTVKAANQNLEDLLVKCPPDWTGLDLKKHLTDNHSLHPTINDQRLIYCGHLLSDELKLSTQIRHSESNTTLHLVCASAKDSSSSDSLLTNSTASSSSTSPNTMNSSANQLPFLNVDPDGLRQRNVATENILGATVSPDPYQQMYYAQCLSYMAAMSMANQTGTPTDMNSSYTQLWAQAHQQFLDEYRLQTGVSSPPLESAPLDQNAADEGRAQRDPQPANDGPENNAAPEAMAAAPGPVQFDDGEGQPQDWLDSVYMIARASILFFVVYFHASTSRLLFILSVLIINILYNSGWLWFRPARRAEVDRPINPRPNNQPQGAEQGNAAPNQADAVQPLNTPNQGTAGQSGIPPTSHQGAGPSVAPPTSHQGAGPSVAPPTSHQEGAGPSVAPPTSRQEKAEHVPVSLTTQQDQTEEVERINLMNMMDNNVEGGNNRNVDNAEEVLNQSPTQATVDAGVNNEVLQRPNQHTFLAISWTFLTTFFTSLFPEQPEIV